MLAEIHTIIFMSFFNLTGILSIIDRDTGILSIIDRDTGILSIIDRDTGILLIIDRDTGILLIIDRDTGILSIKQFLMARILQILVSGLFQERI